MLTLKRFCGDELYPLTSSKWFIIDNTLWINLTFSQGMQLHEDTEYLAEEPTWELSFEIDDETILKKGSVLENANESDEDAYLYYCEHNPTYKNRLEILDSIDGKLLVRISAECCDINYYDGSKGNDILEFTAWIEKRKESDRKATRSKRKIFGIFNR